MLIGKNSSRTLQKAWEHHIILIYRYNKIKSGRWLAKEDAYLEYWADWGVSPRIFSYFKRWLEQMLN